MNEQAIREAAIAEILHPTLAITQQFLAVNKVVFNEQVPCVEDGIVRDEKRAEVYFPIEGERYYFVVYLDVEPQISVRWVGISPGNRVYFYAKSEEHPIDELIAMAGVEPTKTWEKESARDIMALKFNHMPRRLAR